MSKITLAWNAEKNEKVLKLPFCTLTVYLPWCKNIHFSISDSVGSFTFGLALSSPLYCSLLARLPSCCLQVENTSPMVSLAKFQNGKLVSQMAKACPVCAVVFERSALRIDYTARVVFPLGFFLCATVYWGFYLSTYMSTPFPEDTGWKKVNIFS